ncbi:PQQ-binding-like beta-propeller repeat protein [Thioalkalivibrio sp. HK1]|uniref:PQQ-binding-like beta-propeller repeat protein n=1 Tax=Thioalkalivibrio sp. HK1 TaxID=1469245 RepID=UPI00046F8871|nr:PQQ-binding-like beta-propeller repeat protein [Thioalkalivibrio sp. HK1]
MLADRRHPLQIDPQIDRTERRISKKASDSARQRCGGDERRRSFLPKAGLAGVAGLVLAGCGNLFERDNALPPADLVDFEPSIDVREIWSKNASSGTGDEHIDLPPMQSDEGHIIVAGHDGDLSAYSKADGGRRWRIDTGIEISGGPGVGFGQAVVGSREGQVIAFSVADGSRLWEATVSSEILSTPAIGEVPRASIGDASETPAPDAGEASSDDAGERTVVVIVRTVDGRLFALDGAGGDRLWVHDSTVPALSLRGTGDPVVAGDRVLAGFDSGLLAAIALASGDVLWEARLGTPSGRTELDRLVDIDAGPSISGDTVYTTVFQEHIAAVDLLDGQGRWQRDISSHTGATPGARLYVADNNDHLWALSPDSGDAIWRQEGLEHRRLTRPVEFVSPQGEYLVVGDFAGYLHWIDATNGDFVARTRSSWRTARVSAMPLITDEAVFVLDDRGTLTAWAPKGPGGP